MAISFPLDFSGITPKPASISFTAASAVASRQSPFTYQVQTFVHAGGRWTITVELPPMTRAQAEVWIAQLSALNGQQGTFLLGDPKGQTSRGVAGTASPAETPLVDGASQVGATLATDGWTPSTNNLLLPGDWIQLGGFTHLYKVVEAVDSDGAGDANIEIWPALHEAPGDGAAITFLSTKGKWRLTENQRIYAITPETYSVSFSAIEVIS